MGPDYVGDVIKALWVYIRIFLWYPWKQNIVLDLEDNQSQKYGGVLLIVARAAGGRRKDVSQF